MIIIVRGLPGSGKTTLAKNLLKYMQEEYMFVNMTVLSTDKIRKELYQSPKYTGEEMSMVYKVMSIMTKELLANGINCILDATFINGDGDSTPQLIKEFPEQKIKIIECECPEDIALDRIKNRKNDYSDADVQIYRNMKDVYVPTGEKSITINTSGSIDLKKLTDILNK